MARALLTGGAGFLGSHNCHVDMGQGILQMLEETQG